MTLAAQALQVALTDMSMCTPALEALHAAGSAATTRPTITCWFSGVYRWTFADGSAYEWDNKDFGMVA